jgi:hypothetical protein
MYVCISMYVHMYLCIQVRMWAKHAAAFVEECKVHNRDISAGTVTILRTKQQGFNSRRGKRERGSEPKAVIVRVWQSTKLRAYLASLVHSGQQ